MTFTNYVVLKTKVAAIAVDACSSWADELYNAFVNICNYNPHDHYHNILESIK